MNFRIIEGPQEIFVIDHDKDKPVKKTPPKVVPKAVKTKDGKVKRYAAQVKASTSLNDAEQMSAQLDKARFKNYILSLRGRDKRMIHRVRLGPYASRTDAKQALQRYKERFEGEGSFIIKITTAEAKNALR